MLMMLAPGGTSSVGSAAESIAMNAPATALSTTAPAVPATVPVYLAGTIASPEQLAAWAAQFLSLIHI